MLVAGFERGTEIRSGGELGISISGEGMGDGKLEGKSVFGFFFVRVEGTFLVDRERSLEDSTEADFVPIATRKRFSPSPCAFKGLFAHTCRALTM